MQYMLLIYEDETQYSDEKALGDMVEQHRALVGSLGDAFKGGSGLGLSSTATTIRTGASSTKTVHDGPFVEAREQLGGYYLIDVPDLDAALDIARRVPIRGEGSVEVRPLME